MRTLAVQAKKVQSETTAALGLVAQLGLIEVMLPRQYVAELIVVRMFSLFEAIVEDSACRMICGVKYCDGTSATLLRPNPTRSFDKARDAMRHYGRTARRNELRWNRASEIAANLEMLLNRNEHFIDTIIGHGIFVSDLRKVRNHIAPRVPGLTAGKMLLSARFSPTLVERFCRQTHAVLKAALKG